MKNLFLPLALLCATALHAQTDSSKTEKKIPVTIDGYVDAYYTWSSPEFRYYQRNLPAYYSHARRNEININHALLTAHYKTDNVRANLGLHAGTYADANGPAMIYEANAGFKLAKGLWLDAGIMPSHIGIETAISKDNATLTRSIAAEYSPYYETGVKLTYECGDKWTFAGLFLNGWQNVQKFTNSIAGGTQITFKPNDRLTFNSSTYYGEAPPFYSLPYYQNIPSRFFHDFYFTWKANDRFDLSALFDIGFQQQVLPTQTRKDQWMTSALIGRYAFSEKWKMAARGEYINDPYATQVLFQNTMAYSLNLDYNPYKNVWLRAEGKYMQSDYINLAFQSREMLIVTGSLAVAF
jgi:hypothetical protein